MSGSLLVQMPWTELGTFNKTTMDADSALAVTERKYSFVSNSLTNVVIWSPLPRSLNKLLFRFRGKTNGDDAKYIDVWMGRLCGQRDCDLHRIVTLDVEIGTQVAWNGATNYTLYADEIALTNNTTQWPVAAAVYQSSNDTELQTQLLIDPCGCDLLVFHGHSDIAAAMAVDGSGYYSPN